MKRIKGIMVFMLALLMTLVFVGCDSSIIPSVVKNEIVAALIEEGIYASDLKVEFKHSNNGASIYLISGKVGSVYDEDYAEYKDGSFFVEAVEYDGEVALGFSSLYKSSEYASFKENLTEELKRKKAYKKLGDLDEILDEYIVECVE